MTSFSLNLEQLMNKRDMSDSELADLVDVNRTTVTRWRKGIRSPKLEKLPEIANIFGVAPLDLISEVSDEDTLSKINDTSTQLIKERQQNVLTYAQTQLEEQNNVISIEEYKECNEVSIVGKLAAGKGTSNFDKTRPLDIVNVRTEEIPDGYDLAFQIAGDSMEPHFKDEEIAYVKELSQFIDKKIYAVEVNDEAFIKKVYRTSEGYLLVSLNNDTDKDGKLIYPPITVSDTDDFHIIGKVL